MRKVSSTALTICGNHSYQPFGHMGCFNKKSFPNRDIKYYYQNISMTGSVCIEICRSVSLRYAATKGHYCFCNKSISHYNGPSNCNYKCPGKKTEICGGNKSLSIYDTLAYQPFGHMGCFNKKSFPIRDIKYYYQNISMTGSVCIKICRSVSLRYAATKGHYCFCNKNISHYNGPSNCNYKCPGKKTEICGGNKSLSIYDTLAAVKATIRSTTPNSTMKRTSEITSTSTEQVDHDTGRGTDDLVSVYISVPVLVTTVAALTGVVFCLKRKSRHTDDQYVCFRRKNVIKNSHPFNTAVNKTFNVKTSNDDSNCSHRSSNNTVSIGILQGQYTTDATKSSGTYDTLQGSSKANTIKTSDCFQTVYDHVIVGNHIN
ncbi:uncharacterized protein LOC123526445 isoform X2 [Mercenaria mercenaria]|uniref:uncharacterized protein LOC123526445 isoform X2 n=1 Tax=Mercenaria mercenaria TaxID=6596 RepID=UPI00234E6AC1|nr:uncharacterized protein LOC123526445 isoform X2 [Mercenaria mercenaria]